MIPAFFVFLSNTGGSTLLNDATNIMNQASATCSADDRGENQMKDATRENPAKTTHTDLKRKMEVRHLRMISLGGVIGTGLFLSSGYTINQAGPLGTVIAYAIGAVIVYLVMLSLGELSVAMPENRLIPCVCDQIHRSWNRLHRRDPVLADLDGRIGVRIHRCRTYLRKWFPGTPVWIWSALFIVVIFTSNALSVRFFAETEFWFSFIKVAAIVLFILIGGCAVFGVLPIQGYDHAPLFENFVKDGLFPNGWMPVFTTMLTVNFAFSGTELIGVTAGETKDPDKAIPKAIHTTLFRLVIFFIGSIVVMASLIPWQDAGVDESPFVLVFNSIGLPFAGDVMNFVVLTAILSAANSGLYASTRMLWSLANEDMIPHNIAKTNSRGVPMTALRLSMIGGLLALLSSVVAASTVYLVLVSVSGLAVVIVCFQQFGPSDRLRTSRSSCIRTTVTSTIRKPKPGRLIPPVPNRPSPIWYRNGSTREPDSLEDAAERLQTISEP